MSGSSCFSISRRLCRILQGDCLFIYFLGNKHFVANWWNSNFTRRPYFKMRYNERINLSQIYWKTLQGYKKWSHIKNWSHDDYNDYKILKNNYFLLIEPCSYLIPSWLPHRAFTTLAFGLVAYDSYDMNFTLVKERWFDLANSKIVIFFVLKILIFRKSSRFSMMKNDQTPASSKSDVGEQEHQMSG